ncbi:hypothetical protein ACSHUI_00510 [Bacillus subtilis]|uniref:hypothetical protein n=1 Tax=Bacillus subtilis TaxID=1423 RepID=UPI0025C9A110|nr:hypothetical protein [Bacillus subtilis]WCS67939.1 hypothetical protein Goe26_00270 [Bacillus phage vB_BsuM-Goe26]GLI90528.1 hypothetical protein ANABIO4_38800 [Bacillus subtilis]
MTFKDDLICATKFVACYVPIFLLVLVFPSFFIAPTYLGPDFAKLFQLLSMSVTATVVLLSYLFVVAAKIIGF